MLNELLKIKLYWNRANSHLSLPLGIFEKGALMVLLLKTFGVYSHLLAITIILILITAFIIIGWADIRYGIFSKETSLYNQYNPEIQKLVGDKKNG